MFVSIKIIYAFLLQLKLTTYFLTMLLLFKLLLTNVELEGIQQKFCLA